MEKIVVLPINKGLKTNRLAFNIDSDSFPVLDNAYQWRGRVKRKRGTSLLTHLQRFFNSTSISYSQTSTILLDGSGNGNLIIGFSLESNSSIIPGSVTLTASSFIVYTDPSKDGTLSPSGTINYASGAIVIAAEAGNTITAIFLYYPDLPVLGLHKFVLSSSKFSSDIAFDNRYSYNILNIFPYNSYDVSFYKNPPTSASLPGYIQKNFPTPVRWHGQTYQQFWSFTYQQAFWATNGITVPFVTTNIGMQFKIITNIVINTPTQATITIATHGLVVGDFVFINEVNGVTGINFQTGYVITVVDPNTIVVVFPNASLGGAYVSGGIAQYLTNTANASKDPIRWYDGDPTNGNATAPVLNGNLGWVNFSPPLSQNIFSINNEIPQIYYLAGARMILSLNNYLLFLGPVIQTSTEGSQTYLPDTVIFSQIGTPYYTASFQGDPRFPTNAPQPLLTPDDENASAASYFEDSFGFGGFVSAGLDQQLITASLNENALITGFTESQARLIFTGNNIIPFEFYIINSEYGSTSTFSSINMDRGVITKGDEGYTITGQTDCTRMDVDNPDLAFEVSLSNNGSERFTAIRDYINEYIYFTFLSNSLSSSKYIYPNKTLLYNYRDNSWSTFTESYTTYGYFNKKTGYTWGTIGQIYPTWGQWNVPWGAGASTLLQSQVIAGNQQGFVLVREEGSTGEGTSLFIQSISGNVITSPDHGLNINDFIFITGCLGTVGYELNNKIVKVFTLTRNTFTIDILTTGTYFGSGLITRFYRPFIQTMQFPLSWQYARKTRIGVQRYFLSATANAQIQLYIYLSQNANNPYNKGPIVPAPNSTNDGLIYDTILYTCPENTNIGLTPANINLMTPNAAAQAQIWHRINTSLIGDTVQLGFTLSDEQMGNLTPASTPADITAATQSTPCLITSDLNVRIFDQVLIEGVQGMTQLNGNIYSVTSTSVGQFLILVDSTNFSDYISGGTVTLVRPNYQTAEIELHGFILDVSPSQMLI